jgi:hypothetical protein
MRARPITPFIVIAMMAAVFLAWPPEGKALDPVPSEGCCEPQLEMAACFCSSIFGGETRQVHCKSSPVCNYDTCFWDCNIEPKHCRWYEKGTVLQRFQSFGTDMLYIICGICDLSCNL